MYKEIIYNVKTEEETFVEFTAKELEEIQKKQAELEAESLVIAEAEAEAQSLKDSANAKLAALGLTPEEIAAITG
jgi:hypothetical protein